jgi:hypothetical protein
MRLLVWGLLGLAIVAAGACADRGSVTFQVNQPDILAFNPVSDRLSQYELETANGALVAVATVSAMGKEAVLPLGALSLTAPVDMVMSLFSGSQLQGMARIRDVAIVKEQQKVYEANVRKPLIFVGAALPVESQVGNAVGDGQIFDFTNGTVDLEHPGTPAPGTPKMPDDTTAAAVTSDGTLLLAGRKERLTVYDTGKGTTVDVPLTFTPVRVVVAPRDLAVAALDPGDASGGGLALFLDAASLNSMVVTPVVVKLPGVTPRTALFSKDGQTLYVLSGGDVDPCDPSGTPPAANSLTLLNLDGQIKQTWTLPDFVSDIALTDDGTLLLSRSTANQVAKLVPGTETNLPTPSKLFDAVCPTALRFLHGQVVVVTDGPHPNFPGAFTLLRGPADGTTPSQLALGAPTYQVPTETTPPQPGEPSVSVTISAKSLSAYDMAVSADGLRAVFASRIRYHQTGDAFTILDIDCTADLDAVEYGLYIVDTASGNASYQGRSLAVTRPSRATDACLVCDLAPFGNLPIGCPSGPGDRAAGLAAIFGGP